MPNDRDPLLQFHWEPQPAAEAWLQQAISAALEPLGWASRLASRLRDEAGCRLVDLVDTVVLAPDSDWASAASRAGWQRSQGDLGADPGLVHPGGLFPVLAFQDVGRDELRIYIKVECVADFLAANDLSVEQVELVGQPGAPCRHGIVERADGRAAFGVVERHGRRGFDVEGGPSVGDVLAVDEMFRTRRRRFDDDEQAFDHAQQLIDVAIGRIGQAVACDRFFAAEREYWQRRNDAARFQRARQDRLGIGWANHDHHTYRSSRRHFRRLIALWESLGLRCRERFYAGSQAGWGAQVMEDPLTGIVTFNDVDLTPQELMGDFSHDGLDEADQLHTVGLWCALHGEAVHQAGMHHLEGTFDFDALRDQLRKAGGIRTMQPFTDFPHLRQAFTEGQRWQVCPRRIDKLLARGLITSGQAETFRQQGAIGSHLENLERNGGFKGFNQQGVSQIIAATDPRRQSVGCLD